MRVTVIAVDQHDVALVRGTSALGWRGKFGCPLVAGDAVFIPLRGCEEHLRVGNNIGVETGYEAIADFEIAADAAESMQPLVCPGDYKVRGRVIRVAPEGLVTVSVRGLVFQLERQDIAAKRPEVGDSVAFCLQGLSLWDTGA